MIYKCIDDFLSVYFSYFGIISNSKFIAINYLLSELFYGLLVFVDVLGSFDNFSDKDNLFSSSLIFFMRSLDPWIKGSHDEMI